MYPSRAINNSRAMLSKQSRIVTKRTSSLMRQETSKTCRNGFLHKMQQGCKPVPSRNITMPNGYCGACFCKPCTCSPSILPMPISHHSSCCCCCCCDNHHQTCTDSLVPPSGFPLYNQPVSDSISTGMEPFVEESDTFEETPTFEDIGDIEFTLKSPSKTLREAFRKLVKHIGSWGIDNSALIEIVQAPTTKFIELGTPEASGITVALDNTGVKGVITEFNEEENYSYTFYLTSSDKATMLEGKFYTQQSDPIGNSQHGYGTIKYLTEGIATDIGSTYLLKALAITKCTLCQDDYGLGKLSGGNRKAINELRLVFFNKLILSKGFEFIPSSGASSFNPYWETEFQEYYQEKLNENLKILREYIGGQICGEILGLFVDEFVEKSLETHSSPHYPRVISKFPYYTTIKSNFSKRQIDFQEENKDKKPDVIKKQIDDLKKKYPKLTKCWEMEDGFSIEVTPQIKILVNELRDKWEIDLNSIISNLSDIRFGVFGTESSFLIPPSGYNIENESKELKQGCTIESNSSFKPWPYIPAHLEKIGPDEIVIYEKEPQEIALKVSHDVKYKFIKYSSKELINLSKKFPKHILYLGGVLYYNLKKDRIMIISDKMINIQKKEFIVLEKKYILRNDNDKSCAQHRNSYSFRDPFEITTFGPPSKPEILVLKCFIKKPSDATMTLIHELFHNHINIKSKGKGIIGEEKFVQYLTSIIRLQLIINMNEGVTTGGGGKQITKLKAHWEYCLEKLKQEFKNDGLFMDGRRLLEKEDPDLFKYFQ